MPTTTEGLLLVLGALFLLIGIVGGNFELTAAKIPAVGRMPRIASLAVGAILLTVALVLLVSPADDTGAAQGDAAEADVAAAEETHTEAQSAEAETTQSPAQTSTASDPDADADCSLLRSANGGDEVVVTFRNSTKEVVNLYLIGSDEREEHYGSLAPGEVVEQSTYVNHSWCVRDVDGRRAVAAVTVDEGGTEVVIR